MITKEKYLKAVHNEYRIIRHLFEKIPQDGHKYRPSDKQRSTLELLSYLTVIGSSMMHSLLNDGKWPEDYTERMQSVTMENFLEKIDEEERRVADNFSKFTPEMMCYTFLLCVNQELPILFTALDTSTIADGIIG